MIIRTLIIDHIFLSSTAVTASSFPLIVSVCISIPGSDAILEVIKCTCQRLCEEMDPKELDMIWKCLFEEITGAITNDYMLHINHLLMLLASAVQNVNWKEIPG